METHTISESLFEEFWRANRLPCLPVSPGPKRTPDYEVQVKGNQVVCEVKQIDPNDGDKHILTQVARGEIASFYVRNRVRDKLKNVSTQVRTAADAGTPTMVVLYNNTPAYDYTEHSEVVQAMFGQRSLSVSFSDSLVPEPKVSKPFFGGERRMTPQHNTAVSALAVIERTRNGQLRLRVYHNPYAAVRLDPDLLRQLPVVQPVLPDTKEIQL